MIYKLKRYSKSTIPIRKPDIKFRNNNIELNQYNNLEGQELQDFEPEENEVVYENEEQEQEQEQEEPQEDFENYYTDDNI